MPVTREPGTSEPAAAGRTSTRARRTRAARAGLLVGTAVALTAGLTACGGQSLEDKGGASGGGKGTLVIGSAGFPESEVLAQAYAQVLRQAGYTTSIKTLTNRELYEPALEKGQIDVVPEYLSTLADFLNAKVHGAKAASVASHDPAKAAAALKKLAAPRGLEALPYGPAADQNAFAVTKSFAADHHLKTLSDLGKSHLKIKLAAGEECETRPFCAPGLKKSYGIDVTGIDPKGVGTVQAKQAVKNGTDQLVLTTTTDATLGDFGLVALKDDKGLQNADNLVPVVNRHSAGGKDVAAALDKVTKALTTADLTELNNKIAERQKPADVARAYLKSKGLSGK